MARKPVAKPKPQKPTVDERAQHKRFVEMAKEVDASESPKAFDSAFKKVVTPRKRPG